MTPEMGCKTKVAVWFLLIGVTSAEVTLNGVWKENFGWEVRCSWETWLNDTLQSVRMFRNDKQFVVYRPETSGAQLREDIPSEDFRMTIFCRLSSPQGQRGSCIAKIEVYRNTSEDIYKCEVSGERPHFRLEYKEYNAFVPPTYTSVKQIETDAAKKVLNCTSSGLPAPKLIWTVNGQKIPEDFTYTAWNKTSKLWHSWSSYNPQSDYMKVTCTPVVTSKNGQVERGWPVEYVVLPNGTALNSAAKIIVIISLMTSLWR
ncbi:uncharacterized protein LOC126373361 [Pectinophora gossypiella]|uniref:uncharacterized protein LOC126373361 n=1 Tax=Pectinophora gossypiella TaxID=13191 RepID=UPI00214E9861|nr:uncharacterized protein LOC126373361 [Pectinophora gossypiella]